MDWNHASAALERIAATYVPLHENRARELWSQAMSTAAYDALRAEDREWLAQAWAPVADVLTWTPGGRMLR